MTTPPNQPPQYSGYAPVQPMSPADERLWATLVHIGGIFFNFIPALIAYLVVKDRGPFVRAHTATALNFQLTLLIASVVAGVLTIVLIGFVLLAVIWVANIVFSIIAAIKANRGEWYTYPATIRFVS